MIWFDCMMIKNFGPVLSMSVVGNKQPRPTIGSVPYRVGERSSSRLQTPDEDFL